MNTSVNTVAKPSFPLPVKNNADVQHLDAEIVNTPVESSFSLSAEDFESITEKLADVSKCERIMSFREEYRSFKVEGESIKVCFLGIKDAPTPRGGMLPGVYWMDESRRVYYNQAMILVDEIRKKSPAPKTLIEIIYKGKKKTRTSSADDFEIFLIGKK